MRAHDVLQVKVCDSARANCCRATNEEHNASSPAIPKLLKHSDCHTQRHTSTTLRALVLTSGPWVPSEIGKDTIECYKSLRNRQKEPFCTWGETLYPLLLATLLGLAVHRKAKKSMDSVSRNVLGSAENIATRSFSKVQFVHMYHATEGNQTNQSIFRENTHTLKDRVLQKFELVLRHCNVKHKKENGRTSITTGKLVFNSCVLWDKLGGEIHLRDILSIVGRKVVACHTERAAPHLRAHVCGRPR
mmetsp:Transcript_20502/g.40294  ORF Transcript_20502/g.40294 Transcript_20502/m.40294 type:complete len:246 (-) Transcript_20502:949-1686(-)